MSAGAPPTAVPAPGTPSSPGGGMDAMALAVDPAQRWSRQIRFAPIGAAGQARIAQSRVAIIGCGALGCAVAEQLCRAGVGTLRLIDRDLVEWSNLQRQSLYSEADAAAALPKAVAARQRLLAIASSCRIDAMIDDVRASTVAAAVAEVDLVIDGSDSFATRQLINEACCRAGRPWIYGACVGAYGVSMPIVPGDTPCLACIQDQIPAAGDTPTCDSAGIIPPAVHLVAAWQVAEALKLLSGAADALRRELWACDLWAGTFQRLRQAGWRHAACPVCGAHPTFPALRAGDPAITVLCGRDLVQVRLSGRIDPAQVGRQLGSRVLLVNPYLVRWQADGLTGTCFADGRVLVHGVGDAVQARAFCARWLG
jgi:molybdopterin/thiamine biosynthesis adenylyltransferase